MSRRSNAQLNIRSDAARRRVAGLIELTGKSATQVAGGKKPLKKRLPRYQLLDLLHDAEILLVAHSFCEAFSKLIRGGSTDSMPSAKAAMALSGLASRVTVRALSSDETMSAIDNFARIGGRDARLYDDLIGHVAVIENAKRIVTWNVKDMAPLFPTLDVVTPPDAIGAY